MYHPLAHITNDKGYYDPEHDLSASLIIGNQVIPSQEIQGIRESYAHLMHCADKPILVSAEEYRSQNFFVWVQFAETRIGKLYWYEFKKECKYGC